MEVVDRQRICQNTFGFPMMTLLKALSDVSDMGKKGDGLREDKSTNIIVEKVRDYHSARTNQSYEERVASPIDRVLFGLSASANISLLAWDLLSQLSNEKDIALLPPGASSEYRLRATVMGYERIRAQILLPRKSETITVQGQTNPMKNE
ncbi:hypothetical protein Tco_1469217 [Tanacetum coccineum]